MSRTVKKFNGCRYWQGGRTDDGYGQTTVAGLQILVHRLVYELQIGEIGPRLVVMHTCDHPPCCEPEHLVLGTYRDNVLDAQSKGRFPVAGPKETKEPKELIATYGLGRHHFLQEEDVREIKRMRAEGKTQAYCALAKGVTQACISQIDRGIIWKGVI